jgi:hypothetical protein
MVPPPPPISPARKASVITAALLAALLAAAIPGIVIGLMIQMSAAGRHPQLPFTLELSLALIWTASLFPGAALAAPLTVFLARITQPRNSAFVALGATAIGYVLLLTGAGFHLFLYLFESIQGGREADYLVQQAIGGCVNQFVVLAFLCLALRFVPRTPPTEHLATAGDLPSGGGFSHLGTAPERRQMLRLLAVMVLLAGGSLVLYRENQLRRVPKSAWDALRHPREMTLFSIDSDEENQSHPTLFSRHKILAQTPVTKAQDQQAVFDCLRGAVAFSNSMVAMCFNPRHGVRVSDGTDIYDFLICFECHQMYVIRGENLVGAPQLTGSRDPLDNIFRAAGIELPELPSTEQIVLPE